MYADENLELVLIYMRYILAPRRRRYISNALSVSQILKDVGTKSKSNTELLVKDSWFLSMCF